MTTEPVDLLRRFVDSYNDRTLPDAAESIFAPDLVVVNEAAGVETEGLDAYLEHAYHGMLRALPDVRVDLVDYDVDGSTVSCTLASGGTFDGTMETPEGAIPGAGQPVDVELHVEADVADGRVARWVSSYDVEDWQRQVGPAEPS